MSTLPILLLQSRPEDEVSDNEYESICRLGGIDPQRVQRLRMERDELGEVNLADYAAIMMGGGPANFAASESKKSPELEFVRAILVQFCSSAGAFFFSSSTRSMRFSACRASSLSFSGASCFLSSRATMP